MAPRCSLLLLQLGAATSCLCLLAASCPVTDAAPPLPPSRGVLAGTTIAPAPPPAAGVPRTAVDDDGNSVPTTTAREPDDDVAGVVHRAARRPCLRLPHHLRLSDTVVPADAPAATTSSSDAPATAPSAARPSLLAIFSPVLFILGCGLFVACLFKSADLCAAAKARRVRPLGQDQDAV